MTLYQHEQDIKEQSFNEGKAAAEETAIRNMLHADISIEKIIAMGYDQELVLKLSKEN